MGHPIMFDEDDPVLALLRQAASQLPEVHEKVSHGRPFLCAGEKGKGFAMYGASEKTPPKGYVQHEQAVILKPDPAEARVLADDDRFFSPMYYGPSGWLALDLDVEGTDWDEVAELLDASYRQVATARLVRLLDER